MTRQARNESGTGVLGTALGASVFLAFLLLATHTLLGLYATSVVSAAAWDGARFAATHADEPGVDALAESQVRQRLHGMSDVAVAINRTDNAIAVHVGTKRPSFLPVGLATATNLARIDRTAHARIETVR